MTNALQWLAIVIELAGLTLVAIELYAPRSSQRLVDALESGAATVPAAANSGWRGTYTVVTVYIAAWVFGALAVSFRDPALNLAFNLGMTVFTVAFSVFILTISYLMRLGVLLGRGNTVGGIGLVLAGMGVALEVAQLF